MLRAGYLWPVHGPANPKSPNTAAELFPTTRWTRIAAIQGGDGADRARALDEVMGQYRFPLYCLLRKRGLQHHDAEDVLHEFLSYLLRNSGLERADASVGRLRSFLSAAVVRFMNNWLASETKRKRCLDPLPGAQEDLSRYEEQEIAASDTPESLFEKQWAIGLITAAFNRLASQCQASGQTELFAALSPVLLSGGTLHSHESEKLAASLSLKPGALRTALWRMRTDFRQVLRAEVRETVALEREIDAEIAHLFSVVAS